LSAIVPCQPRPLGFGRNRSTHARVARSSMMPTLESIESGSRTLHLMRRNCAQRPPSVPCMFYSFHVGCCCLMRQSHCVWGAGATPRSSIPQLDGGQSGCRPALCRHPLLLHAHCVPSAHPASLLHSISCPHSLRCETLCSREMMKILRCVLCFTKSLRACFRLGV
jgi:hypothetical protein